MLEKRRLFPNLNFDEKNELTTIETQPLKNNSKILQYTDDTFSSQMPRLCLQLKLSHTAFDKIQEHSLAGLKFAKKIIQF